MYPVTLLNTSGWAFFQGSGTITAGTNGEVVFRNTGTSQAWAHSGTVSGFTQFEWAGNFDIASSSCSNTGTDWIGVYAYDSANGVLDGIGFQTNQPGRVMSLTATWTGSTSAAPAGNTFGFVGQGIGYPTVSLIYRAVINAGPKTVTYFKSVNGGLSFDPFFTTSAASNTPTWTDILVMSACGDMTVYSLKTQ
jgi:hypothetical protein